MIKNGKSERMCLYTDPKFKNYTPKIISKQKKKSGNGDGVMV